MCGIYGMVSLDAPLTAPEGVDAMAARLRHRGPDGDARVSDTTFVVGTQHLRITSPADPLPQPCTDPSGRYVVVCNGEIYNARALRRRHATYPYRTANDVEVILPVVLAGGLDGIATLEGMFALAIVDRLERRLVLARDRAGEKPLFIARHGDEWWFASEIAALLAAGLPRRVDRAAVRDVIALGYPLEPRSLWRDIEQVEAGSTLVVTRAGARRHRWWHPERARVTRGGRDADRLDAALRDAVRRQAEVDVPLGIFASGGLDSSLLTAMLAADGRRVPLYTVGVTTPTFDERAAAGRLAAAFDCPLITVDADLDGMAEAHASLTDTSAEPLTDPAALPTWLLARAAAQDVRVILSGEGADELFGGYPTYLGHAAADALATLPPAAGRILTHLARAWPVSHGKVPVSWLLRRFLEERTRPPAARHHAWFGSGLADAIDWHPDGALAEHWAAEPDPLRAAMLVDYSTYLREGLLRKIDRTTMRWGLEARAPFLDRAVTALAWELPTRARVRPPATKVALRTVARRYLPGWVLRRRKRGLSVPVHALMTGPLRADVDRLLGADAWPLPDVLQSSRVAALLDEQRRGVADHARALWILFTLAAWHTRWVGDDA